MMEGVVALLAVASLIVGPLVWSVWPDRARERSLAICAEIQSVTPQAETHAVHHGGHVGSRPYNLGIGTVPADISENGKVRPSCPKVDTS
jgi:hypothetical protein